MEVHKTKSAVSKVRIVHGKKLADSNMAGHCRTDEHVEPWERFSTDFLRPKDDSSYSSLPPAYTSLPHLKSFDVNYQLSRVVIVDTPIPPVQFSTLWCRVKLEVFTKLLKIAKISIFVHNLHRVRNDRPRRSAYVCFQSSLREFRRRRFH